MSVLCGFVVEKIESLIFGLLEYFVGLGYHSSKIKGGIYRLVGHIGGGRLMADWFQSNDGRFGQAEWQIQKNALFKEFCSWVFKVSFYSGSRY